MDLFSFKGRINRQKYWIGLVLLFIVPTILGMLLVTVISDTENLEQTTEAIGRICSLILIIGFFSLSVRRWHDIGKSGWFSIFSIILFVAIIVGMIKGTDGVNDYGDDPLGDSEN